MRCYLSALAGFGLQQSRSRRISLAPAMAAINAATLAMSVLLGVTLFQETFRRAGPPAARPHRPHPGGHRGGGARHSRAQASGGCSCVGKDQHKNSTKSKEYLCAKPCKYLAPNCTGPDPSKRISKKPCLTSAKPKKAGSDLVLFPEATLTSYYFPYVISLDPHTVRDAVDQVCKAARDNHIWVIVGTIEKTADRHLNLAHVISPAGDVCYQYAKVHMAGRDEKTYCRGGDKLAFFEIDGILCTLVICRDGRHPELYRHPGHGRRADPLPSLVQLG